MRMKILEKFILWISRDKSEKVLISINNEEVSVSFRLKSGINNLIKWGIIAIKAIDNELKNVNLFMICFK